MISDFYYSAECDKRFKELCEAIGDISAYHVNFINRIQYTEMIEQGKQPHSNFKDLIKVYTGSAESLLVIH
jgi:hypothetical protein